MMLHKCSCSTDREITSVMIYATIAVLSLISIGTIIGYSSIALPVLMGNSTVITLNKEEIPLFASLPIVSQIFGNLSSVYTMKYGRRLAITCGSALCAVGWIVITCSYSVVPLFIGRILTGISAGLCSTPATVYLSEISMAHWRAALTTCTSLFICLGIVLVYLFGFFMRDSWRGAAGLCIVMPAISAISTIAFLPESPIWLLSKGRKEAARFSLLKIRGHRRETVEIQKEFTEMVNYIEDRKNSDQEDPKPNANGEPLTCKLRTRFNRLKDTLALPEVWKPLLILISYFFFQQFSGLYVMMSYAVDIVANSGITLDAFMTTVVLGLVHVLGAFLAIICTAKFRIGRRPITIISGVGMATSLAVLGIHIQLLEQYSIPALPLICVIVFVVSGSFGFVVLPWAMIGELFPTQYVNGLGAVTTCLGSIFNFAVIQLYPSMSRFSLVGTIYLYCTVAIIATFFMFAFLPETLGKTKMEIEGKFKKKRYTRS